ncbi:hypothetical protein L596_010715 [Steinernema carpocapsae]|uniref:GOLD domain-containing protein n=1 Tax=Steinernema carpocapsae TaxID=34508 RepID=A0A4U5PJ44_STECR|nr:hypothetical protein L596_010715 [Steinernema carpocapsae]
MHHFPLLLLPLLAITTFGYPTLDPTIVQVTGFQKGNSKVVQQFLKPSNSYFKVSYNVYTSNSKKVEFDVLMTAVDGQKLNDVLEGFEASNRQLHKDVFQAKKDTQKAKLKLENAKIQTDAAKEVTQKLRDARETINDQDKIIEQQTTLLYGFIFSLAFVVIVFMCFYACGRRSKHGSTNYSQLVKTVSEDLVS